MKTINQKTASAERTPTGNAAPPDPENPALLALGRGKGVGVIAGFTDEIEPIDPEFDEEGMDDFLARFVAGAGESVDPET